MAYEVKQISKSRWIVTNNGEQRSKHASVKDAVRSMNNYIKQDEDSSPKVTPEMIEGFSWKNS